MLENAANSPITLIIMEQTDIVKIIQYYIIKSFGYLNI